jgi:hypothetical protein
MMCPHVLQRNRIVAWSLTLLSHALPYNLHTKIPDNEKNKGSPTEESVAWSVKPPAARRSRPRAATAASASVADAPTATERAPGHRQS